MCGIHASISTTGFQTPSEDLKQLLRNRGPDHIGEVQAHIHSNDGLSYWVSLMSTVLALRGGHVIAQPFTDISSGSALCWNGEAWKIGSEPVAGNDGEVIFDLLLKASSAQKSVSESIRAVLKVLQSISGPFAFVFFDKLHNQIYYGRDRLGRRSLLLKDNDHATSLELSSIAEPSSGPWKEVEADAVYQLTCSNERLVSEPGHSTNPLLSRVKKHTWEVLDYESAVSMAWTPVIY
jgi:asparagine synthetase B (glutamine-hydrolysing)